MRRLAALSLVFTLSSACATASSRWEIAAIGAAVADLASTQAALGQDGLQEGNPLYGQQPSAEKMLALNVGLYGGIWAFGRKLGPVQRQRMWRMVTGVRLLAAGWNLSQSGCACFKVNF